MLSLLVTIQADVFANEIFDMQKSGKRENFEKLVRSR